MRLCFVAAGLLGVVGLAAPRVAAQDTFTGRPAIFSGVAAASGIHETFDRTSGLAVVGEPVWGNLADGSSTFAADDVYGRASVIYPGRAVTKGPGLVCGQLPASPVQQAICDFSFPLSVEAGNQPDVVVNVPQPLGTPGSPARANAVFAKAHADRTYVSTDAAVGGFSSAGVLVESVAAHTRQAFDDKKNPGLLTATAISELKGIDLLAGMLHINSIVTTSIHKVDGQKVKSHKDSVVVGGVTVAGQPAEINQDGVVVTGSGQGRPALNALNSALQQALAAAKTKINLVGVTPASAHGNDQPCGQGSAGGVQFYTERDLSQVPQQGGVFFANITLGQACTDAVASAARVGGEATDSQSGIDIGTKSGANATGTAGGTVAAGSASPGIAGTSARSGVASGTSTRSDASPRSALRRLGGTATLFERQLRGAVVSHRLDILYLAFTLAFVGLCIGSRVLSASRQSSLRSRVAHGR
jgi:hypothetical protein